VINDVDLVAQAHLHALRRPGVRAHALAAAVGLGDRSGRFLVGEVGVLRALGAGDLLAGHREFDLVDADVDQFAHGFAHTLGAVGELRDRLDQGAAGDGDLGAVGQVAGPRDASGVDGVAADHIEPVFRRGGTEAHRVAGVQIGAGGLDAEQQVLLDRHGAEAVEVGGVVPREVGVRVAQPGHQRAATSLDHPGPLGLGGVDGADGGDAVVVDQDVTGVGVGAGGVEDRHVAEECRAGRNGHDEPSSALRLMRLRSRGISGGGR
jgi:hypothetical protein